MVSWNRWTSWGTVPTASAMLCRVRSRTSVPSRRTAPSVTSYSRGTSDEIVLLPAPEGPTSATICPGSIRNEIPLRTHWLSSSASAESTRPSSSDGMETVGPAG
jgi:hypothetical protein